MQDIRATRHQDHKASGSQDLRDLRTRYRTVSPFLGLFSSQRGISETHLPPPPLSPTRRTRKILSGRQSKQRQSESNLAITLISIVFMHILCNILRIFLGVLVVALVGKFIIFTEEQLKLQKYSSWSPRGSS